MKNLCIHHSHKAAFADLADASGHQPDNVLVDRIVSIAGGTR